MTVSELQLQFIRLYKEMDATYYQLAAAQELSPSEMDIYYTLCVLGDGCLQRDICNLALTSKQTINSALKKWRNRASFGWKREKAERNTSISLRQARRYRSTVFVQSIWQNRRCWQRWTIRNRHN